MSEQIKELIEKIQQEGFKTAEAGAKQIKSDAVLKAAEIIEKATVEAHGIIAVAKEAAAKTEQNTRAVLVQAARDMLLGLRKEITSMLETLIVSEVRKALTPDELAKIITTLIKDNSGKEKQDIVISLRKEDIDKMEKGFIEGLKGQAKQGICLKASEDILGGFIISYDAGKSHYDFTDKALAEYIGTYLKPALSRIMEESV